MNDYKWTLKDANFTKDKGKVFSCFSGGGGSTMGYKLAGFDVIGNNEIDKKMNDIYLLNHKPNFNFNCDIKDLLKIDLPNELFNLDILDGSPPCSSFSIAGNREKDWGKEKKFKEGQKKQVLDTLFFDFIDLAKRLQPKLVISENVKGLLIGAAKDYVKKIYKEFEKAGYYTQHYLLKGENLGLPQRRHRVFFISVRKDLIGKVNHNIFTNLPELEINFNYPKVLFKEIYQKNIGLGIIGYVLKGMWDKRIKTDKSLRDIAKRVLNKDNYLFNYTLIYNESVCPAITAKGNNILYLEFRYMNDKEIILASSFPLDFNFNNVKVSYVCGMSVPPLMTYRLLTEIKNQWSIL